MMGPSFAEKTAVLVKNTKPHQFLTSLINSNTITTSDGVHHTAYRDHHLVKKQLFLMKNTKPHQFLTSVINPNTITTSNGVHHTAWWDHHLVKKQLLLVKNTKPHQFLTSIDQSKYHNVLKLTVDSGSSPRITLWSSFTNKKNDVLLTLRTHNQAIKQTIYSYWTLLYEKENKQ